MSFLNKLGVGKKHDDDFSLPESSGLPPDPSMNPPTDFNPQANDPFAPPQPDAMNASFADPYGQSSSSFNQSAQSPDPFAQKSSQSFPPTPGQQLAHEYMSPQKPVPVPVDVNDKSEIINVKLDAIRSELASLGHRLTQIEQKLGDKKRGW